MWRARILTCSGPFALATALLACGSEQPARGPETPVAAAQAARPQHEAAALRLVVALAGNEARYRIREQLVNLNLPNDAVGETSAISGSIALDEQGRLLPGESKIVADVTRLRSDSDRRDGYVQRRLLETERFPTVEFTPTAARGLSLPLPQSGTVSFELVGDLTIRGVTRPVRWRVTAEPGTDRLRGTAVTAFTFSDFQLPQPRVRVVLSVADTIRLEYDFTVVPTRSTEEGTAVGSAPLALGG